MRQKRRGEGHERQDKRIGTEGRVENDRGSRAFGRKNTDKKGRDRSQGERKKEITEDRGNIQSITQRKENKKKKK